MSSKNLPNHIRKYRKKSGLSQAEVTWLLGTEDEAQGSRVSRYEHFRRVPDLLTALALHVILGTPVEDLFRGTLQGMRITIGVRAKDLRDRLRGRKPSRLVSTKRELLGRLSEPLGRAAETLPAHHESSLPSTIEADARD